jgi:hypothetical protein
MKIQPSVLIPAIVALTARRCKGAVGASRQPGYFVFGGAVVGVVVVGVVVVGVGVVGFGSGMYVTL